MERSKLRLGDLDKFVTWSDNPGLVLSYLDATNFPEGKLAQEIHLVRQFLPFRLRRFVSEPPVAHRREYSTLDCSDPGRLAINLGSSGKDTKR